MTRSTRPESGNSVSNKIDVQSQRVPPPSRAPAVAKSMMARVRGKVLLLLCAMYFITYLDRVSISTAAPFMRDDLNLSNTQLGVALSAFAVPYAFFQIIGGLMGDRFGPRRVLGITGLLWTAATAATGLATGLTSLVIARLGLGFGEGASFPTATTAMSKWMPEDKRGLAQGVTHSAARIGNAIAPLLIAGIIASFGWRASFLITGGLSFLWVIAWYWYFRDEPKTHPKMTETELAELPAYQQAEDRTPVPWGPLLRRILPITFIDFCYGWTLWVYLTWIPTFFKDNYGLDLKGFALFTSLVLFAGVVGDTAGGIISDRWYRTTGNLKAARQGVLITGLMGSFAFTMPTIFIHDLTVAAVCLAMSFFFLELTNPILWSMPMDIAPAHAGTASGLMNTGFGIAGILSPFIFGLLVDQTGSWVVPFVLSSALLFIGAGAAFFIDPTRRIGLEPTTSPAEST